jgi:ankyrin repeat protein
MKLLFKSQDQRDDWFQSIVSACSILSGYDSSYHVGVVTSANPRDNSSKNNESQQEPITIHQSIIFRDEYRLRDILANASNPSLRVDIDDTDDDGFTSLHYACIFRLHTFIQMLYDANANVVFEDTHGFTPLHWSALQLDSLALNIMLTRIIDPDVANEKEERTPLFIACVEGKNLGGRHDIEALRLCLSSLLSRRADPNAGDGRGVIVLHYLASDWKYDAIQLLTFSGANIYRQSNSHERCNSALHHALRALPIQRSHPPLKYFLTNTRIRIENKNNIGASRFGTQATSLETDNQSNQNQRRDVEDEENNDQKSNVIPKKRSIDGVKTVKALLQAGCRPNARNLDGLSPIQVLVENLDRWSSIRATVNLLLIYGARLNNELVEPSELNQLKMRFQSEITSSKTRYTDIDPGEDDSEEGDNIDNDIDKDLLELREMTWDEAIEVWTKKSEINVDSIGLG